jgi:hypothetical protein
VPLKCLGRAADIAETVAFLRTRRARPHPEDVFLPDFGGRRRAAPRGDRQAPGVSVDSHPDRTEGCVPNPSDAVFGALACALRLDEDETRHLHRLARPQPDARPVYVRSARRLRSLGASRAHHRPDHVPRPVVSKLYAVWTSRETASVIGEFSMLLKY